MDDIADDSFGVSCPVCGCKDFKRTYEGRSISVPYGPEVEYLAANCYCFACQFEGDFYQENDEKITESEAKSRQAAFEAMVENLSLRNYAPPYIERVLRIPQGSIKRWRERCSPEAAALLRILVMKADLLAELDHVQHGELK